MVHVINMNEAGIPMLFAVSSVHPLLYFTAEYIMVHMLSVNEAVHTTPPLQKYLHPTNTNTNTTQ